MFRVHVLNQGIDQFFNIDICVIATRGYGLASLAAGGLARLGLCPRQYPGAAPSRRAGRAAAAASPYEKVNSGNTE